MTEEESDVEKRMIQLELRIVAQIKLWFLSGLFAVIVTVIGGFAGLMFYLGGLAKQFDQSLLEISTSKTRLESQSIWIERKDAIDDDLIRFMRGQGYVPPEWYRGKDADSTLR